MRRGLTPASFRTVLIWAEFSGSNNRVRLGRGLPEYAARCFQLRADAVPLPRRQVQEHYPETPVSVLVQVAKAPMHDGIAALVPASLEAVALNELFQAPYR